MRAITCSIRSQQGAALVVVLCMVMLVAMTIIGVTGMQTTILQEKMAGNMRDRDLAFQAAEAALREAELFLQQAVLPPFNGEDGLYQPDRSLWNNAAVWSSSTSPDSVEYSGTISGVAVQPRYIIEELPPVPEPLGSLAADEPVPDAGLYRITARSVGGTERAVVILQTIYKR